MIRRLRQALGQVMLRAAFAVLPDRSGNYYRTLFHNAQARDRLARDGWANHRYQAASIRRVSGPPPLPEHLAKPIPDHSRIRR